MAISYANLSNISVENFEFSTSIDSNDKTSLFDYLSFLPIFLCVFELTNWLHDHDVLGKPPLSFFLEIPIL